MMKNSYGMNAIGCLLLLSALSFLGACSPAKDPQAKHEAQPTEVDMNLAHQIQTESPAIPPIDASVPAVYETASFGLG
jgi:hypothetical protein